MKVLITVGTTEFDELIFSINNREFVQRLTLFKCSLLNIQLGRGIIFPTVLVENCLALGIQVNVFKFKDKLVEDMINSDLIISHCGAGTILELLRLNKVIVLVINSTLQENHQSELAEAVSIYENCITCFPETILHSLQQSSEKLLFPTITAFESIEKIIPIYNANLLPNLLESIFEFEN